MSNEKIKNWEAIVEDIKRRLEALEAAQAHKSRYPWAEAPEWAMWAAKDRGGAAMFYQFEPTVDSGFWKPSGGNYSIIFYSQETPDWQNSLEKRPGT